MEESECTSFQYDFDDNIALSVVFGLCFVIGLVMMFTGYRIFRVSLFIQVFSLISLMAFMILQEASGLSVLINSIIAACCGIGLGLIGAFVKIIGLLFCSMNQSIFLTSCVLYVVNVFLKIENVFIAPAIVLFSFMLLLIPVLKFERSTSVVYFTSFGVILIMLAIDFYLDLSMLRRTACENMLNREKVTVPCWFSWSLLGLWPILLFLGVVVQFLKTASGYNHKTAKSWFANDANPKVRLLSNKSDVIAKAWVQNTTLSHERRPPTGSLASDDEVFLVEATTPV